MKIKEYQTRMEMYLYAVPKNLVGCEIGVSRGGNAIHLYQCCKPKKMYLVDLWPKSSHELSDSIYSEFQYYRKDDYFEQVKSIFAQEIHTQNVEVIKQGSLRFLNSISNSFLDWIYIDSTHMYDHVKKELEISLLKVKRGGLVMGHDFVNKGGWRTGVIRAVLELCNQNKMKMIGITCDIHPSFLCEIL